jgi:hypothetical protein
MTITRATVYPLSTLMPYPITGSDLIAVGTVYGVKYTARSASDAQATIARFGGL